MSSLGSKQAFAALGINDRSAGQTGLMRMQRNSTRSLDLITGLPAAAQRDFPKPDIQIVQIGQTPIRTFAAPKSHVSVADEADIQRGQIALNPNRSFAA